MELHNLTHTPGSKKNKYRVARGMAQGRGKQAGRGQSGQKKRNTVALGFEGGQNPWYRRLPKFGFNNVNHVEYQVVSLGDIDKKFNDGETIGFKSLKKAKLISRNLPVKVLANGKITKKVTLEIDAISQTAKSEIEKLGGKIILSQSKVEEAK